jgi:hypothetical protein
MEFKGSKTEKNLLAAFAGESQARTRYTYLASEARKDGYEQIAAIFLETAESAPTRLDPQNSFPPPPEKAPEIDSRFCGKIPLTHNSLFCIFSSPQSQFLSNQREGGREDESD